MMSFKQSHLSNALYVHGPKPTLDVLLKGHGFVVPQCKHQEKQWVAVFQSIAAPKQRTFDLAGAGVDGGRLYSRSVFIINSPMRGRGMAWPLLKLLFAVTWSACSDNACLCTVNVSIFMWVAYGKPSIRGNQIEEGGMVYKLLVGRQVLSLTVCICPQPFNHSCCQTKKRSDLIKLKSDVLLICLWVLL